jgi:hypothetical protein
MRSHERSRPKGAQLVRNPTLQARIEHHLALLCANLGCLAIEARAIWPAGDSTVIAEAVAGAAEGDVQFLQRLTREEK